MNRASFYTEEQAVSRQELSRRYVRGKKAKFEFYMDPAIDAAEKEEEEECTFQIDEGDDFMYQDTMCELAVEYYGHLISIGIKPEKARRVLPQSMYTTIWSAWLPSQLESFFKLSCDSHTQTEHQRLAYAMKDLIKD